MIQHFLTHVVILSLPNLVFVFIFRHILVFVFVFVFVFLTLFTLSLPDLVALASPEPELPTLHLDLSCDPLEVTNLNI